MNDLLLKEIISEARCLSMYFFKKKNLEFDLSVKFKDLGIGKKDKNLIINKLEKNFKVKLDAEEKEFFTNTAYDLATTIFLKKTYNDFS